MRGRGISFHCPVNSGEAGGHRSKRELCWPNTNLTSLERKLGLNVL